MYQFVPVALVVAGLLTLAAPTAEAAKKKSSKVVGTIKAVNDGGKRITVEVAGKNKKKKKAATEREIKITDATKVKYVGKEAKADGALKVGQSVALKLDKTNADTAVKVKVGNAGKKKNKKKAEA